MADCVIRPSIDFAFHRRHLLRYLLPAVVGGLGGRSAGGGGGGGDGGVGAGVGGAGGRGGLGGGDGGNGKVPARRRDVSQSKRRATLMRRLRRRAPTQFMPCRMALRS
jgi:hypothetical protein